MSVAKLASFFRCECPLRGIIDGASYQPDAHGIHTGLRHACIVQPRQIIPRTKQHVLSHTRISPPSPQDSKNDHAPSRAPASPHP